jgi:hypothetical protein
MTARWYKEEAHRKAGFFQNLQKTSGISGCLCQMAFFGSLAEACHKAFFIDVAYGGSRHFQGDEALLLFQPKALNLQIREEFALGFIVRVRNVVSHDGLLSCKLTNPSHVPIMLKIYPIF